MRHEPGRESRGHPSTNGSAHNGSSPYTNGTNGVHEELELRSSTYHRHNREEVTRILLQSLSDLGYRGAASALSNESGYELEVPSVAAFKTAVLSGEWDEAESLLLASEQDDDGVRLENGAHTNGHAHALPLAEGADIISIRFLIRQQKYLEFLEQKELASALHVLRNELTPLKRDVPRLHALSALMMCSTPADLRSRASWDGADGNSRSQLLSDISKSISPSVMIPEHRLATLLDLVQDEQIRHCKYHNTDVRPSLYTDHECSIQDFPLQLMLQLKNHTDEVWALQFSHDGTLLATAGRDGLVTLYDTSTWRVRCEFKDHQLPPVEDSRGVCSLAFSPDDKYLVTCSMNYDFLVHHVRECRVVAKGERFDYPVCAVAWLPDSERFVVGSQSTSRPLGMYSMRSNGTTSTQVLRDNDVFSWRSQAGDGRGDVPRLRITAVAVSNDGKLMAAGTTDNHLLMYDLDTKQRRSKWPVDGQVTSLTFSSEGSSILLNMQGDRVHTMDSHTGELIVEYKGIRQRDLVLKSCFGGAGEMFVLSGSEDSSIHIWRRDGGNTVERLEAHGPCPVNAVAWHPTNPSIFASAGDDHRVSIWTSANVLDSRDHDDLPLPDCAYT